MLLFLFYLLILFYRVSQWGLSELINIVQLNFYLLKVDSIIFSDTNGVGYFCIILIAINFLFHDYMSKKSFIIVLLIYFFFVVLSFSRAAILLLFSSYIYLRSSLQFLQISVLFSPLSPFEALWFFLRLRFRPLVELPKVW